MRLDRRAFVLSAACLPAVPWLRQLLVPAAYAANAPLLCHADFNVANFKDYESYGGSSLLQLGSSGNAPTVSTEQARAGEKSVRIYLNRRTSGSSFRTEATSVGKNKSLQFRRTYWIGFSIYVPSNWTVSSTGEVLFQLHHVPPKWGGHLNFSPVLGLRCLGKSDRWNVHQDYVQTPEDRQTQADLQRAYVGDHGKIAKGEWTDWVIEHRPDWRSRDDGGVGITRIWCNGDKVVDYSGPNCVNSAKGPFIKFGCYKSAWRDAAKADTVSERLYYFDEFKVSRPDQGSYELVAPGGVATSKPPAATPEASNSVRVT